MYCLIKDKVYLTKAMIQKIILSQKNQSAIKSAIKDILIVVIGVAIVFLVMRIVFLDTGNPFYVVSSGSMVPVLKVNDVIIVRNDNSFDELKVGDIIVFHRPGFDVPGIEDRIIVHRINDIGIAEDGQKVIVTKGDANERIIPYIDYPILEKNYIGKVFYVIPGIGIITQILKPPVNFIIIGGILALMIYSRLNKDRKEKHNTLSNTDHEEK